MLGVEAALAALLGGLGRRIAGGVLNQWFTPNGRVFGDTPARILFALLVAAMPALHDWKLAALFVPGFWVGTTIPLFDSIGMGRGTDSYWRSFAGLAVHGVAGVLLPALAAWWLTYQWWWLLTAGFTIAPCYTVGWAITGKDGQQPALPTGLKGATEIGEALWGAVVGAAALLLLPA